MYSIVIIAVSGQIENHGRMARGGWVLTSENFTAGGLPMKRPHGFMVVSGIACPQGGWPVGIFYAIEHFTPYAYVENSFT
jgi:hypothetical protein